MNVFLVDGTYELFRYFYAVPSSTNRDGHEIGAVRGVIGSVLSMLEDEVTHLGVATDHVIESFRNELWPGYKSGAGIDPVLFGQFGPLEDALEALGVMVWPMRDLEADDGLASAAARARSRSLSASKPLSTSCRTAVVVIASSSYQRPIEQGDPGGQRQVRPEWQPLV